MKLNNNKRLVISYCPAKKAKTIKKHDKTKQKKRKRIVVSSSSVLKMKTNYTVLIHSKKPTKFTLYK